MRQFRQFAPNTDQNSVQGFNIWRQILQVVFQEVVAAGQDVRNALDSYTADLLATRVAAALRCVYYSLYVYIYVHFDMCNIQVYIGLCQNWLQH